MILEVYYINIIKSVVEKCIIFMNYIFQDDFKQQELPLARIKKIMKLDEDVKVCTHLLWMSMFLKAFF